MSCPDSVTCPMSENKNMDSFDEFQMKYMGEEEVILVDPQDKVIGRASKKDSTFSTLAVVLHYACSLCFNIFSSFSAVKASRWPSNRSRVNVYRMTC